MGQPPPASFASMTTVGFTGQESDDELGLVNFDMAVSWRLSPEERPAAEGVARAAPSS